MKRILNGWRWLVLTAGVLPLAAAAQPFRCTIDGKTVYQQAACPITATAQRAVDVRRGKATDPSAAASRPAGAPPRRGGTVAVGIATR
ncbi:MAG: hypothetical protein IPM15_14675 [Betaproteobacteria bacterium]|nr:hypothetical protein [Betaproteobacteria bacterium]